MTVAPSRSKEDEQVLRLEYERLRAERDRLRQARGRFSLALGPAPASAGIATTIAATTTNKPDHTLLTIAFVLLAVLVCVGGIYDGQPAYRHLRARLPGGRRPLGEDAEPDPEGSETHAFDLDLPASDRDWYAREIRTEVTLIGVPDAHNHWRWPRPEVTTLQQGVDCERTGALLVGLLWLGVIAVLLAAVT